MDALVDDDGDGNEETVFAMDLREVTAKVCARVDDGISAGDEDYPLANRRPMIVLSDGQQRLELTGGVFGCSGGSIQGAQRIAAAAVDYAGGMALLELPYPEPVKVSLP